MSNKYLPLCFFGLFATVLVGCQSTNTPRGSIPTLSSAYEVSASYQLVIKDENGRVVHRTGSSKVSSVTHDNAVAFSEETLTADFLDTANASLDQTVANVVAQLEKLSPVPETVVAPSPEALPNPETKPPATRKPIVAAPTPDATPKTPKPADQPKPGAKEKPGAKKAPDTGEQPKPEKATDADPEPATVTTPPAVASPPPIRPRDEKAITGGFTVKKVSGLTVTTSRHDRAIVGGRYFVRGAPEVIIDPFTNEEKLISKGEVKGVLEIESIGIFGVKAKLLSGTAEKGNYLEAVEPTDAEAADEK